MFDVIIVGGGVHGVLTALYLHSENDALRIAIFERAKQLLSAYSDTESFPFYAQMFTKSELERLVHENGIQLYKSSAVISIKMEAQSECYELRTRRAAYKAPKVVFCSAKDSQIFAVLKGLSIPIDEVLPAAFPLESNDPRIVGLGKAEIPVQLSWVKMGPPRKKIRIQLASAPVSKPINQIEGKLLMRSKMIWGPVVYKMTQFITTHQNPLPELIKVCINWTLGYGLEGMANYLVEAGKLEGHKTIIRTPLFSLPRRLWTALVLAAGIDREAYWSGLDPGQYTDLAEQLTDTQLITKPSLTRKGLIAYTGGVSSNAVDKSGQSLEYRGIFFAGSILSDHLTNLKGNSKQVAVSIKTLAKKIAV